MGAEIIGAQAGQGGAQHCPFAQEWRKTAGHSFGAQWGKAGKALPKLLKTNGRSRGSQTPLLRKGLRCAPPAAGAASALAQPRKEEREMLKGASYVFEDIDPEDPSAKLFDEMDYRRRVIDGLEPDHVGRERAALTPGLRFQILKRDGFRCKACGMSVEEGARLQIDHLWPVSKGGRTVACNLQALCATCNVGKGAAQ